MVVGLDKLKASLIDYPDSYVIIDNTAFDLPSLIKTDMQAFVEKVKDNLPSPAIFKEMGAENVDAIALLNQFVRNFNLK